MNIEETNRREKLITITVGEWDDLIDAMNVLNEGIITLNRSLFGDAKPTEADKATELDRMAHFGYEFGQHYRRIGEKIRRMKREGAKPDA